MLTRGSGGAEMAKAAATIALEEGEYALIIGQDAERMSVRTEGAGLLGDAGSGSPGRSAG